MSEDKAKILATRQHEKLKEKLKIWKLIYEAYSGSQAFINKSNLFIYRIEDNLRYEQRLKRADYTNHVATLIDMIIGFIYSNPVHREIQEGFAYIQNSIYKGKSLQNFMNMIATNSLKSTVGVLVDSPIISEMTEAERKLNNINPYVVYYRPEEICDFEEDDTGQLEWIILDNSYIDKSDPYSKPSEVFNKRLWTKEYYQDIYMSMDGSKKNYKLGEEYYHDLGQVPFIFVNSRDIDGNNITDSAFEDIVLKSRTIFNMNSWASEILASSAFQLLLFPYENQGDLDNIAELFNPASGGIGDLPVIPFKALSQKPSFEAPEIDVDKFIKMINHLSSEILSKFGLKSEEKGSWESGVAKSIDFYKTEAFLKSISTQLEVVEKKIIDLCSLYENTKIEYKIEYNKNYEKSDIEKELKRLESLFKIPSDNLKKEIYKEMARLTLTNKDQNEVEELLNDIKGE